MAALDEDGDGDLDLVVGNDLPGNLTVFHQIGAGLFEDEPLVLALDPATSTPPGPRALATADLDGDGHVDLISANSGTGTTTVFYNAHVP